ncbi:MAG: transcription antitermination factor NusB [Myxococcota bacterium]|nr:transcription antitermination factor NusB [Myxococcota bacterium]
MSASAPRSLSRQVALQVLYAVDLATGGGGRPEGARGEVAGGALEVEDAFEAVAQNFELPEGARAFAAELVSGVMERRETLDECISEHARNWRLSRMAAVDRNVLRLATFELQATATPTSVVLDQAIELARRFGDGPSPAFVNGVLAAVARSLRPGEDVLASGVTAGEGS